MDLTWPGSYHFKSPEGENMTVDDSKLKVVPTPIYIYSELLQVYNCFKCSMYVCTYIDTEFIHDHSVKYKYSSKLTIGLAVGGGVALLIAIALCVLGTVYYRR